MRSQGKAGPGAGAAPASTPMLDGFVNYRQAQVRLACGELRLPGVCLVMLRDGLIARNEVFFDRVPLRDANRARAADLSSRRIR